MRDGFAKVRTVLNARRHRRGNQGWVRRSAVDMGGCAQRPKASEGESGTGKLAMGTTVSLCSTPEGIGGGIRFIPLPRALTAVKCSTPEGIGGGIRGQRRRHPANRCASAQRPKASEGESGQSGGFAVRTLRVLNARRHRRGNQGIPPAPSVSHRTVLNARRHRRGNQGPGCRLSDCLADLCSTPEGIGGGIRQPAQKLRGQFFVLNARRHRRGNQAHFRTRKCRTGQCAQRPKASEGESDNLLTSPRSSFSRMCSTPEGIGGGIRRYPCREATRRGRGAQRPKASEGESAQSSISLRCRIFGCSTPEGIGGGISHSLPLFSCSCSFRAQRPKASEGESVDQFLTGPRSEGKCSTPEGIGGGISCAHSFPRAQIKRCSTPEGIGGGIRVTADELNEILNLVLNARRHRRGNQVGVGLFRAFERVVLNARRHRRGNQWTKSPYLVHLVQCSTPEGIGGGIRRGTPLLSAAGNLCAQRPKASEGESVPVER